MASLATVPGLAVPGEAIPGDFTPGYPGVPAVVRLIRVSLGQPYTSWETGQPYTD